MLAQNKEFNNIKVHTQYSICEGAVKIDELAVYCKTNKIKAIGLADSYNLCGALEFAEKISKVGTQPIIGTQINILNDNQIGKITLYATSEQGYKKLTKLNIAFSIFSFSLNVGMIKDIFFLISQFRFLTNLLFL